MSNIWKRSLSMFLAIVMVFGMLPMPAFADDTLEPAETPAVEQPVVEEPVVDEPAEEEPAAEDPPVVEEPVVEDPVEEPVVEDPVEEPVVEDPVEEPVVEDPVEEPVVEDPVEEPVVEDPVEEPVIEDEVLTLSGETRKVYFLNTEDWATIYAAWSFDEEDFADAVFPGGEMAADEELENVFVIELPVEADDVVFNDGVEVTEDLLAWEAEQGIEAIHYYAAQLDETLDYFSADEQVEQEAPAEEVTEWLSYADVLEAWKKAQEAAAEAPAEEPAADEPAIIFEEITVEENVSDVVANAAVQGVEGTGTQADPYVVYVAKDATTADAATLMTFLSDTVKLSKGTLGSGYYIYKNSSDRLPTVTIVSTTQDDTLNLGTYYAKGNGIRGGTCWFTIEQMASVPVVVTTASIGIDYNFYYDADASQQDLKSKIAEKALTLDGIDADDIDLRVYVDVNGILGLGAYKGYASMNDTIYGSSAVAAFSAGGDKSTVEVQVAYNGTVYGTVNVTLNESRDPATVTLGSFEDTWDTVDEFKTAVTDAVSVKDNNGADCKANAGLTVTLNAVEGKTNTYTVSYSLSKDGATWLTTSGTFKNADGNNVEVVFDQNEYTVTWNVDGAETVDTYHKGDSIVKPADPSKTGYTFKNWGADVPATMGNANLTFTAQWDINTYNYTVNTYEMDVNGAYGEPTSETLSAAYGTSVSAPHEAKTGFTVSEDSVLSGTIPANNDLVLSVYYARNQYDITLVYNGKTETVEYYHGVQIQDPGAANYKDGNTEYTFQGWDADGNGSFEVGEVLPTATENAIYKAIYTDKTTWDVTVVYGNGTADASGKVEDGKTYTIPEAPTYEGYRFLGWYIGDAMQTPGNQVTINANTTIEAKWSELFTVTWKFENGADDQVDTDAYIAGETPTAPADPTKENTAQYTYKFAGWTPAVGEITGDTTYTATYTETVNSYTIKFVDGNGNLLKRNTLNYGETPVYNGPAQTKQYYHVTWTPEIADVTGDATYTLVWAPDTDTNNNGVADEEETITVTTDANAVVKVGNTTVANGATYVYDSTKGATVTVTPSKGYYVDVTLDGKAAGTYKNTYQSGVINQEWRNVCTVTIDANSGNHTVNAVSTQHTLELPKSEVTIWTSGYLFSGFSVEKDVVLDAVYGEGNYVSDDFSGNVDEGWGSVTIKLETPFQYKITKNATDKYPAVSANVTVTVKDDRTDAPITLEVLEYTENTLNDVKDAVKKNIKVNGESAEGLLDNLRLQVEITPDTALTTTQQEYTVTATYNEDKDFFKTTETFTIKADVKQYTVKFLDKDGGLLSETKYAYNTPAEDVVKPEAPAVEGHTFKGWTVAKVTADATYTAEYTINQYTIIFKDGATEVYNEDLDYGTEIVAPADPEKEGHTFVKWIGYTEGMTVPTEDKTFTASWSVNKYTVTWKWTDGQDVEQELQKEYTFDTSITIPEEIEKKFVVDENTTKTIIGWDGFTENMKMPAHNDLVFTAEYTNEKTYTVTFMSNGEKLMEQDIIPTDDSTENDTVKKPTDPTMTGYRFDGWFTDNETFENEFTAWDVAIEEDITLYAKWVQQVTVTFDVEDIEDQVIDINTKATKPADPDKANAIFGGWFNGETEFNFDEVVTEDVDLTAKWIADVNDNNVLDENETITITVDGNGTIEVKDAIAVVSEVAEEVEAEAAAEAAPKTSQYIFDSRNNPNVTIVATPVVTDGISSSYVKTIGEKSVASLTYGDGFVATETIAVENGDEIAVAFEDVPVVKTPADVVEYNFYTREIPYEDIYNSVITAPAIISENTKVEYEYFARGAMKHTVSIDALDLDSSIKTILDTVGIKEFSFDMPELWQPLDAKITESVSLETAVSTYLTKDRLGGLLDKFNAAYDAAYDAYIAEHGEGLLGANKVVAAAAGAKAGGEAVKADIADIYNSVYSSAMYYGAHEFGYNATGAETVDEVIRIKYSDPSMYWETEATVTLKDSREKAFISGSDVTLTYRDYTDEDLLALFGVADENGNPIEGAVYSVELTDPYTYEGKNVSETAYALVVKFAGNESYRPAEKTFNITIVKASASLDLPDLNITYGQSYDPHANVTLGNAYGIKQELIDSLVEIVIGLDVADLEISTEGDVSGVGAHIQIMLPQDDALATIFKLVGLDVYGEGVTLKLDELQGYLDKIAELLGSNDANSGIASGISGVLETITGLVDLSNVEITFGGNYPTDIGVYLYGAVSTSGNYETAYDVAYLIIKPDATKVDLEWNYVDENGIFSHQLLQYIDLGAHASVEAANDKILTLFLGVDDNGEFVATWEQLDLGNGAYAEIAFIADFGNTMYYAEPLVRPVVIIPNLVDAQIKVDGKIADTNNVVFDNAPVDVELVINTELDLTGKNVEKTLKFYGLKTNTQTYDSETAPTNAGAYVATATVIVRDENGELIGVGGDVTTIIIEPAPSETVVDDVIITKGDDFDLMTDMVHVTTNSGVTSPDMTIISAQIASDGSFDEIGWEAVTGNVNIDVPDWLDAVLTEYAPEIKDGMTAGEFVEKLNGILPELLTKLEEAEASNEIINSLTNLVKNLTVALENVPENVTLTFTDVNDKSFDKVGAYVVAAIVTDSDHIPSADYGILVVQPEVKEVELKWNYEDENGVWTRELLTHVDLWATAFDKGTNNENADATAKITYQFLGIDKTGELVVMKTNNANELPNGAYIQMAYIELELEGYMTVSDMIARPIAIVPGTAEITMESKTVVFDNTSKALEAKVVINGNTINAGERLTVTYTGVQTNGKTYGPTTEAPVHAGVYTVYAEYRDYTEGNSLAHIGSAMAVLTIEPAESKIEVTGGTVTYDGKGHTADVAVTKGYKNADYTLISGGASDEIDPENIDLSALHGTVNVDLPEWLDEALASTEAFQEGVSPAYLIEFIGSYRDDLLAAIPADLLARVGIDKQAVEEKLNAYIDELLTALGKLPEDVAITFTDDITYTEPGYYYYYGIVTDSDHYPSYDTGLLKIVPAEVTITMDDQTKVYGEDDPELTYTVEGLVEGDTEESLNIVVTREKGENVGEYNITATYTENDHYNVTVVDGTLTITKAKVTVTINDDEVTYGDEIPDVVLTYSDKRAEDELNISMVWNATKGSNAGTYGTNFTWVRYDNWDVEYKGGTLTINKAKVTVTVNDDEVTYGDEIPAVELTYSDERARDELNISMVWNATKGSDVGTYGTNFTWKRYDNWDVEYKGGNLTIVPKEITEADVRLDGALTYNGEEQTQNVTVTDGITYEVTGNKGTNAGNYTLTVTGTGNYTGTVDVKWTIAKAKVTVTINDDEVTYGDEIPEVKLTYSDDLAEEELNISMVWNATKGSNAGTYGTNFIWVRYDNWDVEYKGGTLTINKAKVTVTVNDAEVTYGDEIPDVVLTYSDKRAEDELNISMVWNATKGSDAGTYGTNFTWKRYDNWDVEYKGGNLTIVPKAATITAEDKTVVAGNEMPELTAVVEGLIEGDTLVYELSADYDRENAKAGEIEIIVTLGENPNYEVETTNGILTVTEAVAQNEQTGIYYDSLQKGIDDANDGETVILLKNITLSDADMVKTEDNRNVMLNVSGKSITLDLNEKTITVDYNGGKYLYAAVYVADGAELTVTGNGGIDIPENGINVAYMFWKRGTTGSLTIEDGTYHMDDSADSMVYTNGSGSVTVKGGNWTLDTVGTGENGSPWIFNAQGANERHITVTGGTYNFDINHQYWAHEVEIPEGYGLRDNKNGTWTVVEAVCYIVERVGNYDRKVGYEKLSDAIAVVKDGETIHFWKNIDENVTIKQTEGLSFTIDGEDLEYTGKMTVKGRNAWSAAETLTIKDINFKTENAKHDFITIGVKATADRYANNVTVEGCTFTGPENQTAVRSIVLRQAKNVTVKDCEANSVFSLVQNVSGGANLTVENSTVNAMYGINANNCIGTVTIKGVTVNATSGGYAINLVGGNDTVATIEDCVIESGYIRIVNDSKVAYVANINGTNTVPESWLTASGTGDIKVIMNDENLSDVGTTGLVAQNATSGTEYYNTVNYGINDAASGETVKVLTDVTENVTAGVAGVTLDLNQKTITGNLNVNADLTIVDNTVNVESTKEQFIAAGEITGDIKIADGANLNLEAGTYKTDVNDYCADPIYVAVPKQKHENGTWTVMTAEVSDYVCWHVEEGVYYTDLSDALEDVDDEASETIQMLKDYTEKYVIIAPGTTLDLADQTVTATFVVGLGDSYLTGDINSGKLYVPTTNISLSEACYNDPKTGYDVLPVYMDGYYTFSYFRVNISGGNRGLKIDGDNIRFQFVADTSGWAIPELAESATNHKISIVVRLTWKNASGTGYASQDFTYLDETISNMYNRVPGKEELLLTLDGFEALDMDMDTLEVKAMVVSNAGVLSDCEPQKVN